MLLQLNCMSKFGYSKSPKRNGTCVSVSCLLCKERACHFNCLPNEEFDHEFIVLQLYIHSIKECCGVSFAARPGCVWKEEGVVCLLSFQYQ